MAFKKTVAFLPREYIYCGNTEKRLIYVKMEFSRYPQKMLKLLQKEAKEFCEKINQLDLDTPGSVIRPRPSLGEIWKGKNLKSFKKEVKRYGKQIGMNR